MRFLGVSASFYIYLPGLKFILFNFIANKNMTARLPSAFKKLSVKAITQDFRKAVEVVTSNVPSPGPGELLVKNRYVGINASDINHSAGRYDPNVKVPFDCGFEGIGEVVAMGPDCKKNYSLGKAVAYIKFGAFAEYTVVSEKLAISMPAVKAEYIPFLVSGATALLSLRKVGEIKRGETVLVTAAAGGTGQFAVQIAKMAGCHVIGACSTDDKVAFLKSIGCDRPINYTKESLKEVLLKEYPSGIDVVYESVGGDTLDTCIDAIAQHGRIVIIGFIEGYENQLGVTRSKRLQLLPAILLKKSASMRGFFMNHFFRDLGSAVGELASLYDSGRIQSTVDNGRYSDKGPFRGIDSVVDAVEYLYTRKSVGKIVVEIPDATTDATSKL